MGVERCLALVTHGHKAMGMKVREEMWKGDVPRGTEINFGLT